MKNQSIILFLLIALLSPFVSLNAQTVTGYHMSGIITDSATHKPLNYITVTVKADPATVSKVAVTKEDGSFAVSGLKPLKYNVSIFSIGYQTKTIAVDLSADKDLGAIQLAQAPGNLKEITVTGQKPIVKQEADRISYDLQADPDSKGSSVLEMMRKIPYLSVDADENVLLKGNASLKVFINGKPSGMLERNLKEVLKSMPAATIQRIEVITNPPSKYDGEGLAGIINIITNKITGNGYNASLNVNERFPVGGPGTGGSFTFKQGKLGISAFGGVSISDSPVQNNLNGRITTGTAPTNLNQSGSRESDSHSGYGGSEISYELDSLDLISGQFNINGSRSNATSNLISLLNGSAGTLQGFNLANSDTGKGDGMDASFNYQLGFKADKNRLLTFSYRYSEYNNHQNNNIAVFNRVNYTTPDYHQINPNGSSEQTYQVDYVHPVKKLNIEAGIKAILRDNNSDYQYLAFNAVSGTFVQDASRSNTYTNTQNVFAGYNSYRFSLKSWDFQAGIRIEQTVVKADFISTSSQVKQNYFRFLPTISLNKKFKDQSSLNFGFSQRLKRPGINRLNPFVDRSNPGFETSGNPNLRSELINSFQSGYNRSKKMSLNIGLEFDMVNKLTLPVAVYDPATNITRTTSENNGDVVALGTNININYPLTKKLNLSLNGNAMYFWIKGVDKGNTVTNNLLMQFASLSAGYRFDKGWRISASLTEMSDNPTGFQGTTNGYVASSIGLNKDIVKDKLSFSASINNPFTKYRNNHIETLGTDFIQMNDSDNYFRSFSISLNYRFGKLKQGIKKNQRAINNDDVANGKGM